MAFAHDLQRKTARLVDQTFQEEVRFYPLAGGRTDAERNVPPFVGVLRVAAGRERSTGAGSGSEQWETSLAPGTAMLAIRRAQPAFSGRIFDPHVGDAVRAIERPGMPWFEVASFDDRNPARIVLHLNET